MCLKVIQLLAFLKGGTYVALKPKKTLVMRKIYYSLCLFLLPLLAMAQITVTSTADSGPGTLRDAVAASAAGGTIDFNVGGTIVLTSGVIVLPQAVTIDGGASGVTISGDNNSRVFSMPGTGDYTVTLINLQLENGSATTGFGGVVDCRSVFNAFGCTFRDSSGPNGGAVAVSFNDANFVNCNFINNTSTFQAGAIDVQIGTFTFTNCLFFGNQSSTLGGAIAVAGTTTINNCTIVENTAASGGGGFVVNGTLDINNSIIADNTGGGSPDILGQGNINSAFNNFISNSAGSNITIGTNGNITGDPGFFDPAGGNFQLTEVSPCVNTGDLTLLPNDILDMDNDGNTGEAIPGDINGGGFERIVNCEVDMGAFEFSGTNVLYVTNTNDSGPGSLRAMIDCANSDPDLDAIRFNIPGTGPHTIVLESGLPALSDDAISIDGSTQPGYTDTPIITLDGNNGDFIGIPFSSENGILFGLKLVNFDASGIEIFDCNSATITANIITDNNGSQIISFGGTGHIFHNNRFNVDENNVPSPFDRFSIVFQGTHNIFRISNNTFGGVSNNLNSIINIDGPASMGEIEGNFIGTNAAGDDLGSANNTGIIIGESSDITVSSNTIAFNNIGIANIGMSSQQNLFEENNFICNGTAIQNSSGANNNIQPPLITIANANEISGTASPDHRVQIYVQSPVSCPGAGCQGEYVGEVVADGAGDWSFTPGGITIGSIVSAIQTNQVLRNTSAFSNCEELLDPCNPDLDPPTIELLVPNNITVNCTFDDLGLLDFETDLTATDACDGDLTGSIVFVDRLIDILDCSAGGPKAIVTDIYRVTDANGNPAEIEYIRNVNDNIPPEWDDSGLQLTLTAECGDDIDALIAANIPIARDFCNLDGATVSIASITSATTCGNAFERSIFYEAVDLCGNVTPDQYRVDIIVTDNTAPVFTSGPNQSITLPTDQGVCGTVVNGLSVSVSDDCTPLGITVINDSPFADISGADASGTYPPGDYTITFTATDACLNSDTYVVELTIEEPAAPTLSGVPTNVTIECGDPLPDFPVVGVDIFATDGNGFDISGDIFSDGAIVVGDCLLGEAIEVQTFSFFVSDACGAVASQDYVITIVDTEAPEWDDASLTTALTADCGDDIDALVAANLPTATDACGTATVSEISVSVTPTCGNSVTTEYVYETLDNCGNVSPVFYTIIVEEIDNVAPVVSNLPDNITISCGDTYPDTDALLSQVTATDACDDNVMISFSETIGTASCTAGETVEDVYTITAEDACGNSVVVSFSVFITNDLVVDLGADMTICDGTAVTLDAANSGATYEWSTGETTQTIEASMAGTYSVTVTSGNGCCMTDEITITQGATPDLTATGGTLNCVNNSVQLMASSTASNIDYSWTGPNGFTSNEQNPGVTMPGVYTVTATSAEGCTATADATVDQDADVPTATATGGTITCIETSVQLMGSSTAAGVSYAWTGPNGFASDDQNPTVSEAGDYSLTVTAANGCTAMATATVTDDSADPMLSVTGGAVDCNTTSVQLMSEGVPAGGTFSWTGPNGFAANEQNPIVTEAGDYTLTYTGINGCTAMATATVSDDTATPDAMATGGMLDCGTTSIQLMGSSATADVTYAWTGPGGFASDDQNPTVAMAGDYTLTVTAANGCTAIAVASVTQDADVPMVSATGGEINCIVDMVQLMANSAMAGVTYAWTGPNGFASDEQNPMVMEVGIYTVTVEAPNSCTTFATAEVSENTATPDVSAMGGTLDCTSGNLTLSANSTTPNVSYAWTGPDGFNTNEQNPVVDVAGTYSLTVTGENGCTASTDAIVEANMSAAPVSAFAAAATDLVVDFTDQSTGTPDSWSWDFGDGNMSTDQNPQHTYFTAGTYTVCLTVENACGSNTICQSVTVDAGANGGLITFTMGAVSGQPGDIVQVPVMVENFSQVVSFQKSLHVADPAIARLVSVSDFNLTELDATDFNVASDETITSVWFNATPVDVPDGTMIYMLNIELLATVDDCTQVFIDDNPTFVEIATIDGSGNIMGVPYDLKPGEVCVVSRVDISGNVYREDGSPLDEVMVECTDEPVTTNDAAGYYEFIGVTAGQDYTLTPTRNTNHVDGVTAIDLALIQRHILNVQMLDSPYKIIAADVDVSGLVTAIDLVKIQQLILGITSEFPDFNSWRFVDQRYNFVNPANPIQEAFPEVIELMSLARDTANNDFIAMKIGDVNNTAMGRPELENGELNLVISESINAYGEQVIEFRAADYTSISAYQFDVQFAADQMEYVEMIPGVLPGLSESLFAKNELASGMIRTLWYDPTATEGGLEVNAGEVLFTLKFSPQGAQSSLEERIQLGTSKMKSVAYNHNGEAMTIHMDYASDLTSTENVRAEQAQLLAAQPNPFSTQAIVPFYLPESAFIQMQIMDMSGKVVKTINEYYTPGHHQVYLNGGELNGAGMYLITFQSGKTTMTQKLVYQQQSGIEVRGKK